VSIHDTIKKIIQTIKRLKKGPSTEDLAKRMVFSITKKRSFPSFEQWKHLPRSLSQPEKQIASGAITVFIVSLLFLGTNYIFTHQVIVPARGGEYTEALIGSPQFVNPLYANRSDVDRDLTRLVFSGLVAFNGEAIVPDLAESYDISDDGKTYTFILKEDAEFHDGIKVTSEDIAFTLKSVQNELLKSPKRPNWIGVEIEIINEINSRERCLLLSDNAPGSQIARM